MAKILESEEYFKILQDRSQKYKLRVLENNQTTTSPTKPISVTSDDEDLQERIQSIFFEKLKAKTGWGRNEVMNAYKDSVIKALKNK